MNVKVFKTCLIKDIKQKDIKQKNQNIVQIDQYNYIEFLHFSM